MTAIRRRATDLRTWPDVLAAGDLLPSPGVTATVPDGARPPAISADYLLIAGRGTLATLPLDRPELSIGREPSCDLVLDDPGLSRRHAILRLGPPLTIQDLGSTNGVRVGERVLRGGAPVAVAAGASFQIGPFTFLVAAGGAPGAAAAAARRSWRGPRGSRTRRRS